MLTLLCAPRAVETNASGTICGTMITRSTRSRCINISSRRVLKNATHALRSRGRNQRQASQAMGSASKLGVVQARHNR